MLESMSVLWDIHNTVKNLASHLSFEYNEIRKKGSVFGEYESI